MDVFALRDRVVGDYARYVQSFVRIREQGLREFVDQQMAAGVLWPDPLIQLNPAYAPGGSIDDLVRNGLLRPECKRIFQRDKDEAGFGQPLRLYRHQREAIEVARTGKSYVLTTGTGSGKSLAYLIPIIDHVLSKPVHERDGRISAIVVYPMNALCNSQMTELRKFLELGFGKGKEPVSFARYTGQESAAEREALSNSPPDILLTNFMMLELVMTRPTDIDRKVIRAAQGLDFLVLDELHTYRGRQGADVAMLVRRVRERTKATHLRFVGTSATIAGTGSRPERLAAVAEVASYIFGAHVSAAEVIDETLVKVAHGNPTKEALLARLSGPPIYPTEHAVFVLDPLAAWVEQRLGLDQEADGRVVRAVPRDLKAAASMLASETAVSKESCKAHLQAVLMAGFKTVNPETGMPFFPFRLHQFISRGDTVYASVEPPATRYPTLNAQQFVPEPPGDRSRILLPLAFCRECGQEYYVVDWDQREQQLSERGHDIKLGNSLVGATAALIEKGIPTEAFEAVEGDSKEIAKEIKKRNRQELEGPQLRLFGGAGLEPAGPSGEEATEARQIGEFEEEEIDDVALKEAEYGEFMAKLSHKKRSADLWTASFFWPLRDGAPAPPTQSVLLHHRAGKDFHLGKAEQEFARILAEVRPFHWELEFPEVFASKGGFDCMLGNPPWEMTEVRHAEFFGMRSPAIAQAQTSAIRNRMIAELENTDPELFRAFFDYARSLASQRTFATNSSRYPLSTVGRFNLYGMFVELCMNLVNRSGRAGQIVPSGIATDSFKQKLFNAVSDGGRLVSLYDFENSQGLFEGVHRSYKLCLLTLRGTPDYDIPADFAFFSTSIDHLRETDRHFSLTAEEFALFNPNTHTCPVFRSKRDAQIAGKMYRRAGIFWREPTWGESEHNPWGVKLQLMFMMNTDSHLFRTR